MTSNAIAAMLLAAGLAGAQPQEAASAKDRHRMEITLERHEDSEWKVIDPGLVLDKNDRVRFRFRANFDGYLYVMNRGSSGAYENLFPREETGKQNKIEAGREYRVPATQAWFRIDGPPGHDVVYWLVSPLVIEGGKAGAGYVPLPPPPEPKPPPANLLPRCDDSIFRARGLCVDSSAGPRAVEQGAEVPENLAGLDRATARELVIMRKQDSSLISSAVALDGPLLYEFRLAHR